MPEPIRGALDKSGGRCPSAERRHNLPHELSPFIGREREVAELRRALSERRLVTLTGPGGVGKTRLAIEVARGLVRRYADGVWLVELASLVDPGLVPLAVAAPFGVLDRPDRGLVETLVDALRAREMLLVLDNCEHLVAACSDLADALLRGCPDLRILATSREPLRVTGEEARRVPPLGVPPAPHATGFAPDPEAVLRSEAVVLFIDRAHAVRPGMQFSERAVADVAEICRRLDGIPLAIELAAARISMMTPEQIAERLDQRFRLLTTGSRVVSARHRTLAALVDWSHDLLSEPERALFRRLSVFAGGWTLEAAEEVASGDGIAAAQVVDLLGMLVDKSFVLVEDTPERARYCMLETLREYGQARLSAAGEDHFARRRHRDWCVGLVEQAEVGLRGGDQAAWLGRLEDEQENVRAALTWCLSDVDQVEGGLRLAGGLAWFWFISGKFHEGRRWLERSLALTAEADALSGPGRLWRAKALRGAGHLAHYQGDYDRASALLDESLALFRAGRDTTGIAYALNALGHLALDRGDYDRARCLLEESLQLSDGRGDAFGAGTALLLLGRVARARGDSERARVLLERALSAWRAAGNSWGSAWTLCYLGLIALEGGDEARAQPLLEESRRAARALGDVRGVGLAMVGLGRAARRRGDLASAERWILESLRLHHDLADRWSVAECLDELAWIATEGQHPDRAVQLFSAARTLREAIGAPLPPPEAEAVDRALASIRGALDGPRFAEAWSAGATLDIEQVLEMTVKLHATEASGATESAPKVAEARGGLLTRRESEVAALIARGYTNRQIADELVITERTAETHVRNIREKLGMSTRAQVAAWVVEQGLTRAD